MAKLLTEDDIEKALVKFLVGAGWGYQEINAMTSDRATLPDHTGRTDKKQCVLPVVLLSSLKRLNPSVPDSKLVDRKSTRLNSSHTDSSRMPSSA